MPSHSYPYPSYPCAAADASLHLPQTSACRFGATKMIHRLQSRRSSCRVALKTLLLPVDVPIRRRRRRRRIFLGSMVNGGKEPPSLPPSTEHNTGMTLDSVDKTAARIHSWVDYAFLGVVVVMVSWLVVGWYTEEGCGYSTYVRTLKRRRSGRRFLHPPHKRESVPLHAGHNTKCLV